MNTLFYTSSHLYKFIKISKFLLYAIILRRDIFSFVYQHDESLLTQVSSIMCLKIYDRMIVVEVTKNKITLRSAPLSINSSAVAIFADNIAK